jgi:hypothetical protein
VSCNARYIARGRIGSDRIGSDSGRVEEDQYDVDGEEEGESDEEEEQLVAPPFKLSAEKRK